jgi:hypothetical protein
MPRGVRVPTRSSLRGCASISSQGAPRIDVSKFHRVFSPSPHLVLAQLFGYAKRLIIERAPLRGAKFAQNRGLKCLRGDIPSIIQIFSHISSQKVYDVPSPPPPRSREIKVTPSPFSPWRPGQPPSPMLRWKARKKRWCCAGTQNISSTLEGSTAACSASQGARGARQWRVRTRTRHCRAERIGPGGDSQSLQRRRRIHVYSRLSRPTALLHFPFF